MKNKIHLVCSRLRVVLLAGALLIAGASLVLKSIKAAQDDAKNPPLHVTVDEAPVNREGKISSSFAPVVKKVAPGVVKVFTTTRIRQPELPAMDDEFFRRFFGDQFRVERNPRAPRTQKQYGLGSGAIVTEDGYILTNNHVVDGADEVKVALNDGREFTAKVIGADTNSEVAILKIDATGLPHIKLADSDKVEVGDLALAVGNPFGVGQSVTMGMVSAVGRSSQALGINLPYEDFIQTDAAINPGNSGGPLVDVDGRLIGINTFILSRTGGNLGIGFAIPSNLARSVMQNLVEHGRVIRGFLGVVPQDVTPGLAKEFNLKDSVGALISTVEPESPASKAGLETGDVVTEFNGRPVKDANHLRLEVAQTPPSKKVPVKILRDGRSKTLEVTLNERQEKGEVASSEKNRKPPHADERLEGVTVGDLDNTSRNQFGIPRNLRGALITEIDPDSAAYEAGLRAGDVIQELDRKPVRNAQDAIALSQKNDNNKSLLLVWSPRAKASRYLLVDESKAK